MRSLVYVARRSLWAKRLQFAALWPYALAALVLAGAYGYVYSHPPVALFAAETHSASPLRLLSQQPRRVTYELSAPGPGSGLVVYLDEHNQRMKQAVQLPWSTEIVVSGSATPASLVAQANGSGLRCRILVDGEERVSYTATNAAAAVNCTLKG
ncbi:hypothetical protein AOT83_00190 [Mycobacteroides sp. H001]|uniref:MmpS family transport accessory protein n=1 Tax=Mycobacteroides TaxID=670516 RepID=UPI000714F670|nr:MULTISPECIES: MmpS family transport accessory protein [Mycobacteroides]KRQ23271.1 hypothetical protein AOT86_18010 [Mycobacteroides sp. H072]KRQ31682.1 hypothetical protein AOT84_22710 [Mycobacteroides sp. H002]KRQ48239.1 hypothetical protein AOT85_19550 [Mycobacteroides sp. H054]KRQ74024.1 hypothetical protein AOT83_00190 [Mycobacteroides sp. H001]OHU34289.1 hypothetical protein BKG79_20590 [Mycobacteroides chelonae]